MSLAMSRTATATEVDVKPSATKKTTRRSGSQNRSLPIARPINQSISNSSSLAIVGVAVVIAFALFGAFNFAHLFAPTNELKMEKMGVSAVPVSLDSSSIERKLGFVSISGSASSDSRSPLKHVEAVVELLDGKHHTLKVESALLELDPIPANQAVPFHVELADNPNAAAYRIRFRQMTGTE